ncbi:MAG TPA: TonB family protein, partial [Longimicrobium sp.]|nr:TonB family protein [Longimicrobium sp.]
SLLRDAGVGGTVILRFRIGADGTPEPEAPEVVSATHDAFIPAAESVVPHLRFSPAETGGQAVPAWVTLPFTFTPGQ